MEPLSTASAILGIVTAGVKLSTALYDIVETISGAGEEITAVASDLSFFVVVVDELGHIFESPFKTYTDLLETKVKDILKECREVFKGIQRMINRVDNGEKRIPIIFKQRVQWVFRESRVRVVQARLESLKSTLGLMLQTVKLRGERRQSAEIERKVLENLLRAQQVSIHNLETIEKAEKAQKEVQRSKTIKRPQASIASPPKLENSASANRHTSQVLSTAMPAAIRGSSGASEEQAPATGRYDVSPEPAPNQDGYNLYPLKPSYNPGVKDESSIVLGDSLNYGLASGPPQSSQIYKQNIDLLFTSWTRNLPQEPNPSKDKTSGPQDLPGSAVPGRTRGSQEAGNTNIDSEIENVQKKLSQSKESMEVLDKERHGRENSHEAGKKTIRDWEEDARKQKEDLNTRHESIDKRLGKWKAGLIEMNDVALQRLQSESKNLAVEKGNLQEKLADMEKRRQELEQQYTNDDLEYEVKLQSIFQEKLELEEQLETWKETKKIASLPIPMEEPRRVDVAWLDESIHDDSGDDDDDEPELHILKSKASATKGSESSTKGSTKDGPWAENRPEERLSNPASASAESFSTAHSPISSQLEILKPEWCCSRKAWRPPEKFSSATNTLSDVIELAGQGPIWFKASQDSYEFFLGPSTQPFYIIALVPEDLGSYETAQVGWTVIGKTWATPKALNAAGWPYTEDLVGNIWIHQNLNWSQITNLYKMSCSLLDNAIFEEARLISTKRSAESNGKRSLRDRSPLPSRRFFRSISGEKDLARSMEPNPDHHPAFFKGLIGGKEGLKGWGMLSP